MKVEVLKSFTHKGGSFHEGEVRIVDDATGEYFCRAGWVKDLEGLVATCSPSPTEVVLEVQDVAQSTGVENIDG